MNEAIAATQAGKPKALDNIHEQIMNLHNQAVDMGLSLRQLNDRVQGCIPSEVAENQDDPAENEIARIQFAIDCLKTAMTEIYDEINRVNEIG